MTDTKQVVFLDIDGVLNNYKTCIAFGGFGSPINKETWDRVDYTAVRLIRAVSERVQAPIVLSSTWRILGDYKALGRCYNLNIIDRTERLAGIRGDEIKEWLGRHPSVENYAIIDDDSDMLEEQKPKFVHTDIFNGFTWKNLEELCSIFNITPYDINHPKGE